MGSVSLKIGDGTARFRRATVCSSALHLVMLASVLTTNLFALYAFTYAPKPSSSAVFHHVKNFSVISEHVAAILREIDSSERRLHQIERELSGYDTLDPSLPSLPSELKLFLTRHPLPLGPDSRSKITEMVSSVAHSCARSSEILAQFMSYKPNALCPTADYHLPQKLISRGCEPLPRRRCLSRTKHRQLLPLPKSLWNTPSSTGAAVVDKQMWVKSRGKNDFLIDEVLALGGGGIRIGFDIAGGAGNFAARMAERNVTIVTSTLDVGGSVGEFVAARGLFPLQLSPAHRFPFYDSIFDLVHTMNGLDQGGVSGLGQGQLEGLEFLMFDIDRILRAGGLFWLDNYVCVDDERKRVVTRVIERFGYKKLKWVVGEKADSNKTQLYLSAVLLKPARG
ncbi:uncharacterized protein LOC110023933 [Phalaenopsis equestris]|uniref:uncharacterized protein LOC110023933 n=1 Tax=Phalaenopsis equestris TaxID=78828 RepID=UPI0009E5D449|nr:uncharacterized protein LOC110023933 [Phalaenopsis equestris]XP_020579250.1 uncharacterized protein LOC110023933 [Phalaenopsis equestris]